MRWIRFGRMHSEARAGRRVPPVTGGLAMRGVCALVVSVVAVLALGAASASAESLCTDTWTGPSEGEWTTAGDWSSGVPTSSSVACIGTGNTVKITSGTNQTGVVQGKGSLVVSGGSFEVANALEASSIGAFSLTGGTLSASGELDVTSSFLLDGRPTIDGSGRLVLQSGGTGTFGTGECSLRPTVSGATLVNEGTITMGASGGTNDGAVNMEQGATFDNAGTFHNDAYDLGCGFYGGYSFHDTAGGTAPSIVNTGTFESELGSGHEADTSVSFVNDATMTAQSGKLNFTGGGSGSNSTWSAPSGGEVVLAEWFLRTNRGNAFCDRCADYRGSIGDRDGGAWGRCAYERYGRVVERCKRNVFHWGFFVDWRYVECCWCVGCYVFVFA